LGLDVAAVGSLQEAAMQEARQTLSSYVLVGIDAVPVDVIVKGNRVKVVATRTRRVLHSIRLPAPVPGTPPKAFTRVRRESAPEGT
jgi:hypothetical protein